MSPPGGCGYVVSTWQLGDELRKHRLRLGTEYTSMTSNGEAHKCITRAQEDDAWLTLIAIRMTIYRPDTGVIGNQKWLYRVLSREAITVDADMADAALLSCDVWINTTDIETLPANLVTARVMVEEEALALDVSLTESEIAMLTRWQYDRTATISRAKGVTEKTKYMTAARKTRVRNRKYMAQMQTATA